MKNNKENKEENYIIDFEKENDKKNIKEEHLLSEKKNYRLNDLKEDIFNINEIKIEKMKLYKNNSFLNQEKTNGKLKNHLNKN